MHYISTRGRAPTLDFEQATLAGLAADGGLYVPQVWPRFNESEVAALAELRYPHLAARILAQFTGECIAPDELARLSEDAYGNFARADGAADAAPPLKQLDDSIYFLELFHGPTAAFKDFALQLLGRLFAFFLARRGRTCTIVGATSGDTGSAAIEAVRGLDAVRMYMLHPAGRVSEIQRRQMTTVLDDNIHNLAIDGDFDDCQNLVKAMFNHAEFRQRHALAAVNSINWARIAAQIVYYFHAALELGAATEQQAINFAVPTGNFGNVFAGVAARRIGLPINRLIIGSNRNDILPRFFRSGKMTRRDINTTISPSMDIQIPSNFERYLFEICARDSDAVRAAMTRFADDGAFEVAPESWADARKLFFARQFSDEKTRAEMRRVHQQTSELIDPHSAVGVCAARAFAEEVGGLGAPTIVLGTAHPAKFGAAVREACDVEAPLPPSLQAVMQREERMQRVANDINAVKAVIERDAQG
ncbi:MAG: threonine synthase [bacterium]